MSSDSQVRETLARNYLTALRHAIRSAPRSARNEYLQEIREHIREGSSSVTSPRTDEVEELLLRLGPVEVLASQFLEEQLWKSHRKRRILRPARLVLVSALVTGLVGLAIGGLEWRSHYQPLSTQGLLSSELVNSTGRTATDLSSSASGGVPNWLMPKGQSVMKTIVTIVNGGPFAVTVDSIKAPLFGAVANYEATVYTDPTGGWHGGDVLRRVRIPAGGRRVFLVAQSLACVSASKISGWGGSEVELDVTSLGVRHHLFLPISPVKVTFPKSC